MPRRNDVRAHVAERDQPPIVGDSPEATEPATGDVLEEDALDRIVGAERQNRVKGGADVVCHPCHREAGPRTLPRH
jgi:hypothetical protein